ncbi:MAG: hypothetical protein J6K15_12155 [Lachnospiraceae bacterium]|nr:hypothetical protein [Lachnospiraceae bacterium]
MQEKPVEMIKDACQAAETIGMILHRNFYADKELIELGEKIVELAIQYVKSEKKDTVEENSEIWRSLMYHREYFKLKCDLYVSAEWDRIKRETKGRDTSSESWIEFHEKISEKFVDLFAEIEEKYAPKK